MLVDTGSSLNVLPKGALDRLDCGAVVLKPINIVVRAFDGSKRMVHGEVNLPTKWVLRSSNLPSMLWTFVQPIPVYLDALRFMG